MVDGTKSSFLDTAEGEVSFFRSVMRTRPVGIHRHFHALAIRNSILRDTGRSVSFEDIWGKLETLYNLDALEALESEGYDSPSSSNSAYSVRSPSPSENLSVHPFFHEEFALPVHEDIFESLLTNRRLRATASAASTPLHSASPIAEKGSVTVPTSAATTYSVSIGAGKRHTKDKGKMAGLVGGDSDSSALTQESGDEGVTPLTPQESVTGTDGGTEAADDEDVDMEDSPDPVPAPKSTKNQKAASKKGGGVPGRTRSTTASSARPQKKRKR